MSQGLPNPAAPAPQATRSVLAIPAFRKLWNSMVFSSLGDWLGLLATTAHAQQLSGGSYATANFDKEPSQERSEREKGSEEGNWRIKAVCFYRN